MGESPVENKDVDMESDQEQQQKYDFNTSRPELQI